MIGLDSNVRVRLLVGDDPGQSERARRFVDQRCTPESPGFINCVVLAEVVWVLSACYGYPRSEIANALDSLLAGQDRVIEAYDDVRAALDDYRSGRAEFVDSLIGHINRTRGCEATATFDRRAAKLDEIFMMVQ